jgi:hypothetical protein
MIPYKIIGGDLSIETMATRYGLIISLAILFSIYLFSLLKLIKLKNVKDIITKSSFLIQWLIHSFLGILYVGIPIGLIFSSMIISIYGMSKIEIIKIFILWLPGGFVFGSIFCFCNWILRSLKKKAENWE